ncbi:nucleoside/nucleotide kinase family protein [Rhodococcoides yunnanense]|uniref:nucleoside/nucleotide kinase family protein n=1 Tax=Rhodococcoides yunnanense TaxID=278209 RepID=UPI0009352855|nr:nucleoside/nucleotide kinase family protein [Rhodococcus yunnanensis]
MNELIARAKELAAGPGRSILGIVGAPGAGKSTLATVLADELGPDLAAVVPMDGFHLADEALDRLGRRDRKGAPDTFDVAGYANLLARLRDQRTGIVYAPRFDRTLEEPVAGAISVTADVPLVITEGNYLLLDDGDWPLARASMDEVWYIEIDDDVRRSRLVRRHEMFGKTTVQARMWTDGSDEHNAVLVASTASRADLRVRLPSAD